jgi:hypothetical protein
MHDEWTLFKIIVASIDEWGKFRVRPTGIRWASIARDCERLLFSKKELDML